MEASASERFAGVPVAAIPARRRVATRKVFLPTTVVPERTLRPAP